MNILDLKRKALGWMARGTGDGTDGAGDGTNNGGDSNSGPTGGNYGGGEGSGWGGFSDADMAAAMSQMDAQAAENDASSQTGDSGSFSDVAAQEANRLAAQVDADNPSKSAMNPMDAMMAVSSGFGTMSVDSRSINAGEERGWSLGVADRMSDLGYGDREGLNANNKTQSADELGASRVTNDHIMPAVAGLVTSMVPGAGLAMAGMRAAGSVTSGQKSAADAMKDFAIDYGASKVAGMVNSKIGTAIGPDNMASLGLVGSVSKAFGGPSMPNIGASMVNSAMNVAGISKSTGSGFASQNNTATDNGFTAPGENYGGDSDFTDIATPTTPTAQDVLSSSTNLNMSLWGSIDGSGWKAAKANYIENKRATS